jgi:hypothetical protein
MQSERHLRLCLCVSTSEPGDGFSHLVMPTLQATSNSCFVVFYSLEKQHSRNTGTVVPFNFEPEIINSAKLYSFLKIVYIT